VTETGTAGALANIGAKTMRDWPYKFAMTAFLVSFAAVLIVSLPGCQTANTFRKAYEDGLIR
jgi:hypothetical protein